MGVMASASSIRRKGETGRGGGPGREAGFGSACGGRVPGGSCPPVPRSSPQAKFWDHTPERRYSPGAGRASLAARAPPVPARAPEAHAPVRSPPPALGHGKPAPSLCQLELVCFSSLLVLCLWHGMLLLLFFANLVSKCLGYPFSTRTRPPDKNLKQQLPEDRNYRSLLCTFDGGCLFSYYPAPEKIIKMLNITWKLT